MIKLPLVEVIKHHKNFSSSNVVFHLQLWGFCKRRKQYIDLLLLIFHIYAKLVVFFICIAVVIKSYQGMSNRSLIHHKKAIFDVTAGISFLDFLHCNAIP